jgi:anti-anti-sigma factor
MAARPTSGMIKVRCPNPNCRKVLAVKADLGGKKGRCPMCSQAMTIPKPPSAPAEAKPAVKVAEGGAPPASGAPKGQTIMLQRAAVEKRDTAKAQPKKKAPEPPSVREPEAPSIEEPETAPEPEAPTIKEPEEKAAEEREPEEAPPPARAPEKPEEKAEEKLEAEPEAPAPAPAPEPAAGTPAAREVVAGAATAAAERPAGRTRRPKSERELHTPRTLRRIATEATEAAYEVSGNILRVTGAIGYDLNPVFRKKSDELLQVPDADVIVDLEPVLYLSSSHLGVLAELMARAQQAGKSVSVRAGKKAARVIRLAGLDKMCTLEEP